MTKYYPSGAQYCSNSVQVLPKEQKKYGNIQKGAKRSKKVQKGYKMSKKQAKRIKMSKKSKKSKNYQKGAERSISWKNVQGGPDKTSFWQNICWPFFIDWSTSRHFPSYSGICISVYHHVLMEDNMHILLAFCKTFFFFIFGRFPCTGVRIMHVGAPLCGFGERHRHRWRGKWAVLPAPVPNAATYLLLFDVAPPTYSSWMLPTYTYFHLVTLF